jgi:type II secretory pathway pseudopilin PulG
MKFKFTKIKKARGFSILEIVIVIYIITMALIGVMSLTMQNIKAQTIDKNNLIASELAQEGIEIVRSARDNNGVSGGNKQLYINSDGFYTHISSSKTSPFSRSIAISLNSANSIKVSSIVEWKESGTAKNYSVDTLLYNWK